MRNRSAVALSKMAVLALLLFLANGRTTLGDDSVKPLPWKECLGAMSALGEAVPLAATYFDPISTEQLRSSVDKWAKEHRAHLGVLDWIRRSHDRVKADHKFDTIRPILIQLEVTRFNSDRTTPGIETHSDLEAPKRWANYCSGAV